MNVKSINAKVERSSTSASVAALQVSNWGHIKTAISHIGDVARN